MIAMVVVVVKAYRKKETEDKTHIKTNTFIKRLKFKSNDRVYRVYLKKEITL